MLVVQQVPKWHLPVHTTLVLEVSSTGEHKEQSPVIGTALMSNCGQKLIFYGKMLLPCVIVQGCLSQITCCKLVRMA